MAFSQQVNTAILKAFEQESIKLAVPLFKSFMAGDKDSPPVKVETTAGFNKARQADQN